MIERWLWQATMVAAERDVNQASEQRCGWSVALRNHIQVGRGMPRCPQTFSPPFSSPKKRMRALCFRLDEQIERVICRFEDVCLSADIVHNCLVYAEEFLA